MKQIFNACMAVIFVLNQFVTVPPAQAAPVSVAAPFSLPSFDLWAFLGLIPGLFAPAPVPANPLTLAASPNCGVVDQDLDLSWDFKPAAEWAGQEKSLALVVAFPAAFTPEASLSAQYDPERRELRLPFAYQGRLNGQFAREAAGRLDVTVRVLAGEKVLAEASLPLARGSLTPIPVAGGEARSLDGRLQVVFPAGAAPEDLVLCLRAPAAGAGLGSSFTLTAEGLTSRGAVRKFSQPIAITYDWAEGEFDGDAAALSLMFYDEELQRWSYLPTTSDPRRRQVTGYSSHLTEFQYDVNTIDKYKINNLSAFQVAEFSGAGTYSLPLNLPAGSGGLTPALNLSYNSATSDAAGYHSQGGWVGLGWDLGVGEITRGENGTSTNLDDDIFYWQGQTLIPYRTGTDGTTGSDTSGLPYVEYQTQNTHFMRIRHYLQYSGDYHWQGYPQYNWENYCGTRTDISFWKVWDLDGNVYKYDQRMLFTSYATGYKWPCYYTPYESYQWYLTSTTNLSGQSINYKYLKTSVTRDDPNGGEWSTTNDIEVVLHEIYYANKRYYVHFESEARPDYVDTCLEALARCRTDRKRLKTVEISYNPDGNEGSDTTPPANLFRIRSYEFSYTAAADTVLYPYMYWHHADNTNGYTLTLASVQEKGRDGTTLPATAFSYTDRMHLTSVNNGHNGQVSLSYENVPWPAAGQSADPHGMNVTQINGPWYQGNNGDIGIGSKMIPSYLYGTYTPMAPGKRIWLSMNVAATNQDLTFQISSDHWSTQTASLHATSAGRYAVVLPLDQNIQDIVTFHFKNQTNLTVWDVQIGNAVTRYRVTQRTVYPDTQRTPGVFYATTYSYLDENNQDSAALNTPALSDLSPSSDYAKDKVIHTPYTEFRGHGTVKVTQPDGSYTLTHYYQSDALAGQLKDSTLYRADGHKLSATIMGDGSAGSDYHKKVIDRVTGSAAATLPNCKSASPCNDAVIYWTAPKLLEKRVYNPDNDSQWSATRTQFSYVGLDAAGAGQPVYGEVSTILEQENSGSGWTDLRRSYFGYVQTNNNLASTDVNSDSRYFVGHAGMEAVCGPNGTDAVSTFWVCGHTLSNYLGWSAKFYDSQGRLNKQLQLLNFVGSPTWSEDFANRYMAAVSYDFDDFGNVKKTWRGYKDQTAFSTYPQWDEVCYGTPTATGCDSDNLGVYPAWQKNSLGQATLSEFDRVLGVPTKVTDPNGAETLAGYDVFGRLQTVVKPGDSSAAPTLQFSYSTGAAYWTAATQKVDAGQSYTLRKYYNGLGEVIQTQTLQNMADDYCLPPGASPDADSLPEVCASVVSYKTEYVGGVRKTYQTAPVWVINPAGYVTPVWTNVTTETSYDEQGRVTRVKGPDQSDASSQSYSYAWDAGLLKTSATDPKGNVSESWQNIWGQVLKVKPAAGPYVTYAYDAANRLTQVKQVERDQTDANPFATTTLTYDLAGRKLGMSDPDMGTWAYAYDAYGNLVSQTDAKNQRTCLYYDLLNRLKGKNYSGSACPSSDPGSYTTAYTYDGSDVLKAGSSNAGIGRRTGMQDASGWTLWSYDARGRLALEQKAITPAGIFLTEWGYNSADLPTTLRYPGGNDGSQGETVTTDYTGTWVDKLRSDAGGSTPLVSATKYDAAGRVTSRVYGSGSPGLTESYGYYAWNSKAGLLQSHSVGSLLNLSYTYDNNYNITGITGANPTQVQSFGYDALNRLTSAGATAAGADAGYSESYTYDARGRLEHTPAGDTLVYDAAGHIHAASGSANLTLNYDANGSLTGRTDTGGSTQYTYSYDAENRLTGVAGSAAANFVYDGDGRRVMGTVNNVSTVYLGSYYEAQLAAGSSGTESLANPGFESGSGGPSQWSRVPLSVFPATASFRGSASPNSGTYQYSMGSQADGTLLSDAIAVSPGAQYDLSVYLRGVLKTGETSGGWQVRAFFYTSGGSQTSVVEAASGSTLSSTTWQAVGGRVTAPSGAASLKIGLTARQISGWLAFDDAGLVLVGGGGANLAANPGFESGASQTQANNWSHLDESGGQYPATGYFHSTWGPAAPRSGSYAFAISNLAYGVLRSDQISVSANTQYDLYTYVRGVLDGSLSLGAWSLRATYYTSAGGYLGYTTVASSSTLNTAAWQQVGGRLTTPANTGKLMLSLYSSFSAGWAAFDDISLVQVGGGGANLAPNPGFESGTGYAPANWTVFDETSGAFPATAGWRSTWGNATPRSGSYAFSFSTFAYGQLDADLAAAQPNTAYDLSASLRGSLASAQGCGGWVVRALFYDASYQYLGYTNAASGSQPGGSYAQVGSRVTTPARTAWIKVSLQLYLSVGWVSFDDVSLKRVTLESSTQYYYAGGQRVARRVGSGSLQYLFGDHLGSAALVTDSSFTKISELRYNAWGKLRYTDGTAPAENAFTYTGQRQEADLGLMFYNARWYDSALGRFVQADSIIPLDSQGSQAFDRYAYVNNSPLNFNDPSGNFSEDQLKEWYGDNWMAVIAEKFSKEMIVLLTQAEFGDMLTYEREGKTFGALLVQGESGNLVAWDVGTKSWTTIENIDRNSISGFYKRDKDSLTEYSLKQKFSNDARTHLSLPKDYREGNEAKIYGQVEISIKPPSIWGWVGLGAGIGSLTVPGGGLIELWIGRVGLFAGIADTVKVDLVDSISVHRYWMPHNPVPGEPNTPQFMPPPTIRGTPMPPVPLY